MVNLWFVPNHGDVLCFFCHHHHHSSTLNTVEEEEELLPFHIKHWLSLLYVPIWWLVFSPWCPVISPVCFFASGNVPYNNFINLLYRCLTSLHVEQQWQRRWGKGSLGNADATVCNLFLLPSMNSILFSPRTLNYEHVHVVRTPTLSTSTTGKVMACVRNKDTQIKSDSSAWLCLPSSAERIECLYRVIPIYGRTHPHANREQRDTLIWFLMTTWQNSRGNNQPRNELIQASSGMFVPGQEHRGNPLERIASVIELLSGGVYEVVGELQRIAGETSHLHINRLKKGSSGKERHWCWGSWGSFEEVE